MFGSGLIEFMRRFLHNPSKEDDKSHQGTPHDSPGESESSQCYQGQHEEEVDAKTDERRDEINLGAERLTGEAEEMKRPLDGITVFIDPGHGGKDPGAVGPTGLRESDVVLDVSLKLAPLIEGMGGKVGMSRESDIFHELEERASMANQINADIFVSIHCNANNDRSIHGMEVYHHGTSSKGKIIAEYVMNEMANLINWKRNRGVKSDFLIYPNRGFHVLRATKMPAILVELDYISNPSVESHLQNKGLRDKFAESIAEGIKKYCLGNK